MFNSEKPRPSRALRASSAVLLFAALTAMSSRAMADDQPTDDPPISRFYWREAVGAGVFSAESSYVEGRTRQAIGFAPHIATTLGARLAQSLAIGGALDLYPMPPLTVTERHGSRDSRDMAASFGWAGNVGPSLTFMPGRLRFELSPGLFWMVTGAAEGEGGGATLGGFGFGASGAGAYDIPLGQRVCLGFEGRLLAAGYANGDSTHTGGWSLTGTLLVGLRAR